MNDKLPVELLDQILSYEDESPHPRPYANLKAASLVCRRWREPAQRALCATLYLSYSTPWRLGTGQRWLALSPEDRRADAVHSIRVATRGTNAPLRPILVLCTNLTQMSLETMDCVDWEIFTLPALASKLHHSGLDRVQWPATPLQS
ncbi:hypothetical protein RQP46_001509 [Phenoliferia psychrophenolica]